MTKHLRPFRLTCTRLALLLALALVAACGTDAIVEPTEQEPEPAEGLLTDAELATPEPQNAVDLPTAWSEWVIQNHQPIRSLTVASDFSDLRFLDRYLAGRRIVQLGESGHGVKQFSQAKVRLIKYLHQELGYDVIAFESGLFECDQANRLVLRLAGPDILRRCAFQVWHSEEVAELFDYIRQTRQTDRPLQLAGFDSQISSLWTANERDDFFASTLGTFNPAYAAEVEALEKNFLQIYQARAWLGDFAQPYQALLDSLETRRDRIEASFPNERWKWQIARQSAWSMTRFIDQLTSPAIQGTAIRDSAMAVNVEFLADSIFPDQKIMIWAHNYHIMNGAGTMGEWLRQRFGDQLYTIGFYMHQGRAANNARQPYAVAEPKVAGVEALLARARVQQLFVDLASQPRSPGTEWMDQQIMTRSWGVTPDPLVPRAQYDGLVFVHTVTPPDYLRP